MKVIGKYQVDDNFTTVCCDRKIYTIAKNGDWRFVMLEDVLRMV